MMLSIFRPLSLFLLAICAATSVVASPSTSRPLYDRRRLDATKVSTNADLLARGLHPKAPRRLFDASRTRDLLPRQSSSPTQFAAIQVAPYTQQAGRRDVIEADKALYGRQSSRYVQVNQNNGNIYIDSTAAKFLIPSTPSGSSKTTVQGTFRSTDYTGATTDFYYYAGAYHRNSVTDPTTFGHLIFGIFNGNANIEGAFETTMWNNPTMGSEVQISWTDAQGNVVPLNFYVDTTDSNRLCAAHSAGEVNSALTEDARVILTWGAAVTAS